MNKARTSLFIAVMVVLVASACLVAQPASTSVSASPTAAKQPTQPKPAIVPSAAPTVTQFNPTAAPSVTTTAFPSITPLPPPTATATETPYGYQPSSTPTIALTQGSETPDPVDGATDDWGSDTRCTLIGKSPKDWTELQPGATARVSWELLNSGARTWQANQVWLIFIDGPRRAMNGTNRLGMNWDVKVGNSTNTPSISILVPKVPGHYRSVWGLRLVKSGHVFCTFTVKITVPNPAQVP